MSNQIKFQIGKNGLNEGVIDALVLAFKTHRNIRISVLKSSGRDKNSIKLMADEIAKTLSDKTKKKYKYKIIGFTIIMHIFSK